MNLARELSFNRAVVATLLGAGDSPYKSIKTVRLAAESFPALSKAANPSKQLDIQLYLVQGQNALLATDFTSQYLAD